MAIYPDECLVPTGFATDELLVRPLRVSDVQADFEAVVQSREMLRIWDQSGWPEDDFTIEDNLADLQEHQDDHEAVNHLSSKASSSDYIFIGNMGGFHLFHFSAL